MGEGGCSWAILEHFLALVAVGFKGERVGQWPPVADLFSRVPQRGAPEEPGGGGFQQLSVFIGQLPMYRYFFFPKKVCLGCPP